MKLKTKKLNLLISKMVQSCITLDGEILDKRAMKYVLELSKLPKQTSVPAITFFSKLLKQSIEKHTLFIETDYDLTPSQIKEIEKSLNLTKISAVRVVKNKDILGGLRIRVGDTIYDDSVSAKIEQLGVAIRS